MDVTQEVCENSISCKRMRNMLNWHNLELVISLKDVRSSDPDPQAHGNVGDVVHPSGVDGNGRELSYSTVTEMFNYEYLIDSREFMLPWTEQDKLSFAKWFKKHVSKDYTLLSSCRKSNLFVGQSGSENLWFLGTIVVVQVYNFSSYIPLLIIAKSAKFTDLDLESVLKELEQFFPSNYDNGLIALYPFNETDHYVMEIWR